jgi:uncharacterized protein YbjT (DUF2867 family)
LCRAADATLTVRITSRHPKDALLLLAPDRTDVEAVRGDVHDETSVAAALAGAFGAVNAVSLYVERGNHETFHAVHVEAAARIARLAREAGVERLVHVSGIGADPASSSDYIRARGEGEIAYLLIPVLMGGPGGIEEVLDVTTGLLIQARDGPAPRPVFAFA